jgi:hypothetical protein
MAEVKLIKQSYHEARRDETVPKLELVRIVSGSCSGENPPLSINQILAVNKAMVEEAEKLGATYVFGVEYQGFRASSASGSYSNSSFGYGDAYKIYGKSNPEKPGETS